MSQAKGKPGTTRCLMKGCRWWMASPSKKERDEAWARHYASAHPDPTQQTTRCTDPPGCTWSATSSDLEELRALKAEHRRRDHR